MNFSLCFVGYAGVCKLATSTAGERMIYNFNSSVDRKGTDSVKWDFIREFFGRDHLHPMWVADMDFTAPPEILEAVKARAAHGVFGYTAKSNRFYSAVIGWFKKRYNWHIQKEWIVTTPGVVPALNMALQEFTDPGDGVIIQSPVYFPFKDSVELNERKLLDNPLVLKNGRYEIDWVDLENKAESAGMILFCSPHNPVSRVWTTGELQRLGSICQKHDLLVFSDEIHADIVFKPSVHTPTAKISNSLTEKTISAFATSKTFNLAGLQLSVSIIPDSEVRRRFKLSLEKLHLNMSNIFGIVATQAAYENGGSWLDQLLPYLWENYTTVRNYLAKYIPKIKVIKPEGTFLLWLDCRELGFNDEELAAFFVQKAGLALSNGILFGPGGSGFMRMNIGCPRHDVIAGLEKLKRAMTDNTPVVVGSGPANAPDDC
jgi:cystathionine beta-lyase